MTSFLPHTGLAVVGALLEASRVFSELNHLRLHENEHPTFSHSLDVVKSYVGMLCQGKSDFDYLETVHDDDTFRLFLNLNHVPSIEPLLVRMDAGHDSQGNCRCVTRMG